MKLFYIEGDTKSTNKIPLTLEAELDCQVFEADSEGKALNWLKMNELSELSLIICHRTKAEFLEKKLCPFLKKNVPFLPLIYITSEVKSEEESEFLNYFKDSSLHSLFFYPLKVERVIEQIKLFLKEEELPVTPDTLSLYCRVCYSRFRLLKMSTSDVYIKLSDDKYVKILNKGDNISDSLIDHYISKGIDRYYILRNDFLQFSKDYEATIFRRLHEFHPLVVDAEIHLRAYEGVQDQIFSIGLDPITIQTITQVSEATINTIRKDPNLGAMIQAIMKNENYLSEHSLMINYISSALALEMEWVTDSTLQKLSAASILHDVLLQDCDLARISQLEEGDWNAQLTHKQIELIRAHPYQTSNLIKKSNSVDPYVDIIIFNHHERIDSLGFPRHLEWHKIFPLACLFIVSEDFVHSIYGRKIYRHELLRIIQKFEQKYTKGYFKKSEGCCYHFC